MEDNRMDMQNKRALQNTESKIRRLVAYHRGTTLDAEFTYTFDVAVDLLES
jgi:small subunit ribosomal protein S15